MGRNKSGRFKKKENNSARKSPYYFDADDEDMRNDEIDAFHKQRDIIPLEEVIGDEAESDEDDEHPVFDLEDGEEEDEDDEDFEDDTQVRGLAAKIARQQKYLRSKMGGAEDEMDDDAEEEEKQRTVWSQNKSSFYNADNVDYEIQSSDEDSPEEEEEEVKRLQQEKAKLLSMEDFGLEDISEDESNQEPTIEETLAQGKSSSKAGLSKESTDGTGTIYEEVRKDLNALTREEQMDVVYSSAPELVGLLSELNYAYDELENKVNPLLVKIVKGKDVTRGGLHYLEVKQLLLQSYCQAITFYLLLKSEGRTARDHPVISRLVEIKTLLDKLKELDRNLHAELDDIMNRDIDFDEPVKLIGENVGLASDARAPVHKASSGSTENGELTEPYEATEMVDVSSPKDSKRRGLKRDHPDHDIGLQSKAMLKVRAALEERLKQKGVFNSLPSKNDGAKKRQQPMNGQLETLDDFDDDALGGNSTARSSKLSQLVTAQVKKPKLTSGDDDLPKRDDIGERRRKHEMRVLARAGVEPGDEVPDNDVDDDSGSDIEFYKQVEQQHANKAAAKAERYSRPVKAPSLPEPIVDGKRKINYDMEKNRGLTRRRNKGKKNPRVNNRNKFTKAVVRRKGQVRDIRTPTGPYGGEVTGINPGLSRSRRL